MSLLTDVEDYQGCLRTASYYLEESGNLTETDIGLARIWKARAHLGLGEFHLAANTFDKTHEVFMEKKVELPRWSFAWYLLTKGQLSDLRKNREQALTNYKKVLSFAKDAYISKTVTEAASTGLSHPYQLVLKQ